MRRSFLEDSLNVWKGLNTHQRIPTRPELETLDANTLHRYNLMLRNTNAFNLKDPVYHGVNLLMERQKRLDVYAQLPVLLEKAVRELVRYEKAVRELVRYKNYIKKDKRWIYPDRDEFDIKRVIDAVAAIRGETTFLWAKQTMTELLPEKLHLLDELEAYFKTLSASGGRRRKTRKSRR
jgi:hypothetical protein